VYKSLAKYLVLVILMVGPLIALEVTFRVINNIPVWNTKTTHFLGESLLNDEKLIGHPLFEQMVFRVYQRSENPVLFYVPRKNAHTWIYKTNSQGFRDREYPKIKPPNTFRVAVLGDSIIWGHNIELQDTFAKQLERILNTQGRNQSFEVLNFGVSGYSTQQEVEFYREKAKAYDPDMIIIGYCLNDHLESSVEARAFKRVSYSLFSKSYVFAALKQKTYEFLRDKFGMDAKFVLKKVDVRHEFEKLNEWAPSIPKLVLIFPAFVPWDSYEYHWAHKDVLRATLNLPSYSAIDLFWEYRKFPVRKIRLSDRDTTHPNRLGNRIAARTVLSFFRRNPHILLKSRTTTNSPLGGIPAKTNFSRGIS